MQAPTQQQQLCAHRSDGRKETILETMPAGMVKRAPMQLQHTTCRLLSGDRDVVDTEEYGSGKPQGQALLDCRMARNALAAPICSSISDPSGGGDVQYVVPVPHHPRPAMDASRVACAYAPSAWQEHLMSLLTLTLHQVQQPRANSSSAPHHPGRPQL